MRIPTINFFQTQTQVMSAQFEKMARLQTQTSTGKKLVQSSDDPVLADRIKSMNNYIDELNSFNLNLTLAETRASEKASIAKESIDLISKSRELLQRAQNETMSNADRVAIANELEGVLSRQLDLANSSDVNGDYLYSGLKSNVPPYSQQSGKYVYQGSADSMQISIGSNTKISYTDSGHEVFGAIPEGNGTFSVSSNTQSNQGTGVISGGKIVNRTAYIPENYTISFVTNSAGELAYQVLGDQSGQVLPPAPANLPNDAIAYTPNSDITFNGMSVQISGQPQVGDAFNANPSQNKSVFTSLNDLVQLLKTPVDSDKSKADLKQQLGQLSENLAQASDHLIAYEAEMGSQANVVDNQKILTGNLLNSSKMSLSAFSDADLTVVLSDLTTQMTLLQMTQQAYLKIQETYYSIFMK